MGVRGRPAGSAKRPELATGTIEEIPARIILGYILALTSPEGIPHLEQAFEDARLSGDAGLECDAALHLAGALRMNRRWRESLQLSRRMRTRSIEAGLRGREVLFTMDELLTALDAAGDLELCIRLGWQLIDDPAVTPGLAMEVLANIAIALLETGRVDEAREALERTGPEDADMTLFRAMAFSELERVSGRPDRAIRSRTLRSGGSPTTSTCRSFGCREPGPAWSSDARSILSRSRSIQPWSTTVRS